ncbi:SCO family protein [Arenimonas sp.]|uniref:SCO family protein n=1 Tax=Arenimonas sp. TaxID=1872635 RepID=UPI0039E5D2E7
MNAPKQSGFASRSILLVLCAALAAGLGLMAAQRYFGKPAAADAAAAPKLYAVTRIAPARELPAFELQSSDGTALTAKHLQGHWTVVFLGFTHCPDVCPTTLSELAKAQNAWKDIPAPKRPRILFVSVDPDRDTPKLTGEYARYFHPETLAATADEPALSAFARGLGLVYMKSPLPGGDYTMDHSATLVVLDPQGRQAGLIRPNPPPKQPLDARGIADDLRKLTEAAP